VLTRAKAGREIPQPKILLAPIVVPSSLIYSHRIDRTKRGGVMLYWVLMFLIFAVAAAVLGFTGIAGSAAYVAKILFVVFAVLFLASLVFPIFRRRPAA
jgi:uncharacterized membrane protein YtjA (UPF0391 family)